MMPSVELTESEARVLREVLESYLREVSGQISNTEKFEMREELKADREAIKRILSAL